MSNAAQPSRTELPMVMTAAEMRRHWRRGEVRPLSPLLDMTAEYAGHWWNLDGNDAWVRATDPNAIAVYEAQKQRSAATLEELRKKTQRHHLRRRLQSRFTEDLEAFPEVDVGRGPESFSHPPYQSCQEGLTENPATPTPRVPASMDFTRPEHRWHPG